MTQPEFIPLADLLARGRSSGFPVAACAEGTRSWDDLIRAVSGWKAAFSEKTDPRVALFYEDTWTFACALLGAWAAGKHAVVPGDALPATLAGLGLPRVPAPLARPARMPRLLKDAIPGGALTIYTSGSTGRPAAFAKTFDQLGAEVETLEATFGRRLGPAEILSTVSHQHIYGLLFKVLWPLCAGRVIHLPSLFFPEGILAAARRSRAAVLVSSPAHLKRLPETLDWSAARDRWRAVFSSGGPLSFDAAAATRKLCGRSPIEVYGSSETGGIAWRERDAESSRWRSFASVEVALEPESGALRVRSAHLPDREWFTTSDKARLTEGGFELLGRLDRIVKVEEKRVSLAAMEQTLVSSGLAAEARVLTLSPGQDRLGAVVVPTSEGLALAPKALQERLRARLAESVESVAIPKRWRFAGALPINASGKVTEDALRRLFDARPRLPESISSETRAGELVLALRLPKDLFYFDGHFPSAPILPGVAQLDWAVRYGRERLGVAGDFLRVEALKFQQVLMPGDTFELGLSYDREKGRLRFEYRSARGRHSCGSLFFGSRDA